MLTALGLAAALGLLTGLGMLAAMAGGGGPGSAGHPGAGGGPGPVYRPWVWLVAMAATAWLATLVLAAHWSFVRLRLPFFTNFSI